MAEPFSNGNGVESLEARYRHLDDRVGRMGQELAGMSATLGQVVHTLETISRRVNEKQVTPWASIIAGCAFVASLGYSALSPVQATVVKQGDMIEAVKLHQREVSEIAGGFIAWQEAADSRHDQIARSIERLAERSYDTHGRSAATDARLDAVEAKLRDVDMAGSRKWIPPKKD